MTTVSEARTAAKPPAGLLPASKRPSARRVRARRDEILRILAETYPGITTMLEYRNAFELVVATLLAARCSDNQVNRVTPRLFAAYPDPESMSQASEEEIHALISSISFPNSKARYLMGLSRILVDEFDGVVPATIEELTRLPGVGRKTALVVITNCFGIPGFAVDTHVGRISRRLGWSHEADPSKVESDVCGLVPEEDWIALHQQMIFHGRALCTALRPRCGECPLSLLCPSSTVGP